jgi:uncharacterized membrane protein
MPSTLLEVAAKSAAGSDSLIGRAAEYLPELPTNVGSAERWLSAGLGAALVANGALGKHFNILSFLAGGALLARAATGNCAVYQALGVNTAGGTSPNAAIPAGHGVKVEHSIVVNAPASEVYRRWRNFARLPEFMEHLREVKETDSTHSTWTTQGPLGTSVSWDAEIIEDRPNEVISWRSLPGSDVDTAGSVHFRSAGGGTEVRVSLKYDPPAGKVGAMASKLFGASPECQIKSDLERFKQQAERGSNSATATRGKR